jgi:phosphoribosylamine--glycine ligase
MLTERGPQVLEFNVRLGDPEAQVLLLRLENDLAPLLLEACRGGFSTRRLHFRKEAAACIVLAAPGYPGRPATGEPIRRLDEAAALPGVALFHAATDRLGSEIVSAGGRVLDVCATGIDLPQALKRAYQAVQAIDWPGKTFRRDIGRRVVAAADSGTAEI